MCHPIVRSASSFHPIEPCETNRNKPNKGSEQIRLLLSWDDLNSESREAYRPHKGWTATKRHRALLARHWTIGRTVICIRVRGNSKMETSLATRMASGHHLFVR